MTGYEISENFMGIIPVFMNKPSMLRQDISWLYKCVLVNDKHLNTSRSLISTAHNIMQISVGFKLFYIYFLLSNNKDKSSLAM